MLLTTLSNKMHHKRMCNFSTFSHKPSIRFRYAEKKKELTNPSSSQKENSQNSAKGKEDKETLRNQQKGIRLQTAPKRMSLSKEEMDIVMV
eukprot:jgi/Galph1/4954/GphlegSOOS_G3668.1